MKYLSIALITSLLLFTTGCFDVTCHDTTGKVVFQGTACERNGGSWMCYGGGGVRTAPSSTTCVVK